ncbi:unnamed protein product [Albugo candida]|uniref:Uncharacterized protein n=1 Tax=Albugo candida TaxID=65357 RepID=A0A024G2K8_9STRA|nr:unnamed protein product [Albugo candida]|eukprot:CCI40792.1 unnamed protein product [Albugo candida]
MSGCTCPHTAASCEYSRSDLCSLFAHNCLKIPGSHRCTCSSFLLIRCIDTLQSATLGTHEPRTSLKSVRYLNLGWDSDTFSAQSRCQATEDGGVEFLIGLVLADDGFPSVLAK